MFHAWSPQETPAKVLAEVQAFAEVLYDYTRSDSFQTNAGSTPSAVSDPVGLIEDLQDAAPAFQATTGRRPTLTATGWDFDGTDDQIYGYARTALTAGSTFTVPDLINSDAGKGFTCTGISVGPDGSLWVSNDGRADGGDPVHLPSLVHLSSVGALIDDFQFAVTFPAMETVQGNVYDEVDDSVWLCSTAENLVRQVASADGSSISSFASTACNGIAIDTTNDFLIVVSTGGTLTAYNKAGASQYTFAFEVCDCITYDNVTGILYYALEPASGTNYIGMFHLPTRQYLGRFIVAEAVALEGMAFDGTTMYVTNDQYFHNSTGTNQVLVYTVDPVPTLTLHTEITLWAKIVVDSAVANARSIAGFSSGGVTNAGAGMFVISSSTTGIRVFANTAIATTQRSFVDFTSLPDLTTPRRIVVEIDLTAETVDLWVDGTQYGGTKSIPNVSGGIATDLFAVAGVKFASDEMAGIGKVYGFANRFLTEPERVVLDGYLNSVA